MLINPCANLEELSAESRAVLSPVLFTPRSVKQVVTNFRRRRVQQIVDRRGVIPAQ